MIKGFDAASEVFLANLARIEARGARAQQELSSGFRVSRASDAPEAVAAIIERQGALGRLGQLGRNLDRVKSEVDTAESAVQIGIKLMDRAISLAAQASGDTETDLQLLVAEVRGLHEHMVSLTRTTSDNRFVFSGDTDQTPLYALDSSAAGGVALALTPIPGRSVEDVTGEHFVFSRTATDIFDARNADDTVAEHNVFHALWSLAEGLAANDKAAVATAMPLLKQASEHMNRELGFYGAAQNRVGAAITDTERLKVQWQADLGKIRDANTVQSITELTTASTHQQIALTARAKMPQSTLFDYLG